MSFRSLDGWFISQDNYFAVNDSVRGSRGIFRPHRASVAHRPRAPARVDRRRTFGKSDFVQMTISNASETLSIFSEQSFLTCFGPACCVFFVRVSVCPACVFSVCLCLCVRVSVCDHRVSIRNILCTFKESPCLPATRAHVSTCARGAGTHGTF